MKALKKKRDERDDICETVCSTILFLSEQWESVDGKEKVVDAVKCCLKNGSHMNEQKRVE